MTFVLARIAFISGGQNPVSALEKRFGPFTEKVKAYWAAWAGREILGPRQTRDTPKAWPQDVHYEQSDARCSTCCLSIGYSIVVGLVHCHEEVFPTVELRLEGGTRHHSHTNT
jgi:hypothetical protein